MLIDWINLNLNNKKCVKSFDDLYDGNVLLNILFYSVIPYFYEDEKRIIVRNEEFSDLNNELQNMINYGCNARKQKFDLIFKILSLCLDNLNFKEEKQTLIETFIERSFSKENFFLENLCSLLKNIIVKLGKNSRSLNVNKKLSITQCSELEIDHNSSKINSIPTSATPVYERNSKAKNFKSDFKCLDNKNNQIRNNLIIKPSRGIPIKSINQSDEIFQNFYKFLKPTCPILDCSLQNNEIEKYIFIKEESKESKMQSKLNKSEINYEYNLNKFISNILYEWLADCYLIKHSDIQKTSIEDIITRCSNGVLLADLINVLEGRLNPIKGIDRTNTNCTKNKLNVAKILEFLRGKGRINKRFLFEVDKIILRDKDTILGLLFDLYQFYNNMHIIDNKKSFFNKVSKGETDHYQKDIKSNKCINEIPDDSEIKSELKRGEKTPENFLIFNISSNLEKFNNKLEKSLKNKSITNDNLNNNTYGKRTVMTSPRDNEYLTEFLFNKSKESNSNTKKISNFNLEKDKNFHGFNQLSSIKSNKTNNKIFYSEEINSPLSKYEEKVNEIKNWLISIGIKFAKDIDFTKPFVKEFRDGLLLIEIISNLDTTNKILYRIDNYPKSRAESLNNIKNALRILGNNKKSIPLEYLNCEEEIYNAEPQFVLSFLKVLKKSYHLETKFNDTLIEYNKFKTIFRKQLKNSEMCNSNTSDCSKFKNSEKSQNKSSNILYSSYNNKTSSNSRNEIKSIKANKKDNSQRKFYSPNNLARSYMISHPKYAWN